MPAIEVQGLRKSYDLTRTRLFWRRRSEKCVALDGLDFSADFGEVVGVIGANASGKSTLLRILAGLEKPDEGTVRVAGLDPTVHPEPLRGNLGVVLDEERGFRPRWTVRANLELAAGTCGRYVGRPDFEYLLDSLSLRGLGEVTWKMASTGVRRRAAVMRALLGEPRILLLDEPTRSVDSETAEKIHDLLLQAAHSRGACVVMVSHNPDDVRDLCDRSLVLDHGSLLHVTHGRKPVTRAHQPGGAKVV